jgi:electron transfer flavoprotein beta subunit
VHAIVCLKQVPDTQEVKIDFDAGVIQHAGVPLIVNPFDEYAVEEALRWKEKLAGRVTVLTVGAAEADEALRTALAMGCDAAVLLADPAFAGMDTAGTAVVLAAAVKKLGDGDVIFFGKQTFDGDTGMVGPRVAALLGVPMLNFVAKVESLDVAGKRVKVERLLEEGREVVTAPLPAAISVIKEINEPRYPSLMGKRKAKNVAVPTWDAAALGLSADQLRPLTRVARLYRPPTRTGGDVFAGDGAQTAAQLAAKLRDEKII